MATTPLITTTQEAAAAPDVDIDVSEEEKDAKARKAAAAAEKTKGNEAYKAKRFEEALQHYDAAVALDDTDISFLTNK